MASRPGVKARGRTECIKGADYAALGAKVVLVEAMLFEAVHGCGLAALRPEEGGDGCDGVRCDGADATRWGSERMWCAGGYFITNVRTIGLAINPGMV